MPHDAKGNLLNIGDKVYIPATVKSVCEGDGQFCNCDLEFDLIMPGREYPDRYAAINTKQVIKAGE